MGRDDTGAPGLMLRLGFPPSALETLPKMVDTSNTASNGFDPEMCLTLSLSGKPRHRDDSKGRTTFEDREAVSSPLSGASSFSTVKEAAVKREREASSDDAEVIERVSSKASDEEEDDLVGGGNNARKKLRLTKDQSALLEESFKQYSTLNLKQKQILARQLNLRPRQVEVWFQNRRARTKMKQREVDCEILKKFCETLSNENRRLQKELQELKAIKSAKPFYNMHVPAATLALCPSCERVCGGGGRGGGGGGGGGTTKPQFYAHQFTNPSAAC